MGKGAMAHQVSKFWEKSKFFGHQQGIIWAKIFFEHR